jgi:hypothetical protein
MDYTLTIFARQFLTAISFCMCTCTDSLPSRWEEYWVSSWCFTSEKTWRAFRFICFCLSQALFWQRIAFSIEEQRIEKFLIQISNWTFCLSAFWHACNFTLTELAFYKNKSASGKSSVEVRYRGPDRIAPRSKKDAKTQCETGRININSPTQKTPFVIKAIWDLGSALLPLNLTIVIIFWVFKSRFYTDYGWPSTQRIYASLMWVII